MSASSVKAGEAYVEIGIRNRIAQGAAGVQSDLNAIGEKVTRLGATIAASSGALLAMPIQAASRMQETMGKFSVVFGDSANDVEKWSDKTANTVGISEEAMASMLASMQDLLVPMGVLPDRATDMSKTLSTLAVDLGSFNNMDTADVFRDLMSAITGEGQVMKKYGVILTETATKQELLNMGLDPKAADDNAKATARMNIILRGTTAAQGDAIRTADSFANQLKKLWATINDASAAMGGAFIDDITALVNTAVKGVYAFRNFVVQNQDLTRAVGVTAISFGAAGTSLVALGIAARATAGIMGTLQMASQVAASVASFAWSGVSAAMYLLTIKARIASAIVSSVWAGAVPVISTAWKALTGILGAVMQGIVSTLSAAAIAVPWIAAAGVIAVAWFGLDTVLATLAGAAAAAWAASAGTVATAWTATAGVLVPLAVAVSGVWVAAAGVVGAAWTTLSAAFAAGGWIAVAASLIASAAWGAHSIYMKVLALKQVADAFIVGMAWSTAGVVASASWSGFKTVMGLLVSPMKALTLAGSLLSTTLSVGGSMVSTAWSTAWAIVTSPITLFVAGSAAVLAAVGALVTAAGYLALSGTEFGAAWDIASKNIGRTVSIITTVFDAIKTALGSGDYAAAAEVLWLGIQAAFWTGVAGNMESFKWLFKEGWAATKRFFSNLLDLTLRTMKAIAQAIMDPVGSYKALQGVIADMATATVSFDVDAKATGAIKALEARRAELAITGNRIKREEEADRARNARLERIAAINKRITEGSITKEQGQQELKTFDQKAAVDRQVFEGEIDEQKAMEIKLKIDTEGMTNQEVDSMVKSAKSKKEKNAEDTYKDKTNSIELEILALEKGADAAERKRLADEGLTEAQIKQVEALKAKKKQLEEIKALEEKQQSQRVEGIFEKADELREAGVAPDEVFKMVMKQIDSDQQGGKITKEQATGAKETARGNLDGEMDRLKQEGQALAESLRTPGEKLSNELKRISQLQDQGVIDETTATRAEDKVRKEFSEEQARIEEQANQQTEKLDQEQKPVGPNASFSGFAASIIGMGPRLEDQQLKVSKEQLQTQRELLKQQKRDNVARFG